VPQVVPSKVVDTGERQGGVEAELSIFLNQIGQRFLLLTIQPADQDGSLHQRPMRTRCRSAELSDIAPASSARSWPQWAPATDAILRAFRELFRCSEVKF
jgi:hypothetical protein